MRAYKWQAQWLLIRSRRFSIPKFFFFSLNHFWAILKVSYYQCGFMKFLLLMGWGPMCFNEQDHLTPRSKWVDSLILELMLNSYDYFWPVYVLGCHDHQTSNPEGKHVLEFTVFYLGETRGYHFPLRNDLFHLVNMLIKRRRKVFGVAQTQPSES